MIGVPYEKEPDGMVGKPDSIHASYDDMVGKVAKQERFMCSVTGTQHEAWHYPKVTVLDVSALFHIRPEEYLLT